MSKWFKGVQEVLKVLFRGLGLAMEGIGVLGEGSLDGNNLRILYSGVGCFGLCFFILTVEN